MARCAVCDGSRLLLDSVCPLCGGIADWPEQYDDSAVIFDPKLLMRRARPRSDDVSVLTWSICNPDKITYDPAHYEHLSPEERDWKYRFPKIMQEVQAANTSIVCMQQINQQLYAEIKTAFEALGYDGCTHKKMQRNSLAIFYRSPLKKAWEKHVRFKGLEKTMVIGLQCGENVLAVITCQLEGEPEKAAERIDRLQKTFSEIRSLNFDAVVVAGDFNVPTVESGSFDAPLAEIGWRNSALSSYMRTGKVPAGTKGRGLEVAEIPAVEGHSLALEPVYHPGGTITCSKRIDEALCRTAMVDQI